MMVSIRSVSRVLGVVTLGATVAMGGCNRVNRSEHQAVMNENSELRERLAAEQQSRTEAETRNASLEQENRDLASRADRGSGTAAPGAAGARGGTGFEGIEGAGVSRSGSDVVVDIAGDVLFDSGSATLKSTARRTLDNVAGVIKSRYGSNTIRVEGYTDSDPLRRTKAKWESNERLSGERALAVEKYLVSKGVPGGQIYYAGFGPARPKTSKKESRRVEIVILGN
jgi:chemotaxis protein MotB